VLLRVGCTIALACFSCALFAQTAGPNVTFDRILHAREEPRNWLTYSGAFDSLRHSRLSQITPENAKSLMLKWVFQSRSPEKHEATPLVVNGILYTVHSVNDVVALDAATGQTLWTYSHKVAPNVRNCCGQTNRGLAILGNTLYLGSLDAHLIALDATTGKERWNKEVAGTQVTGPEGTLHRAVFTHAPLIIKDKVLVGAAGGEYGVRGFLAAFDANTGNEVWRFYTVPGSGEPGNETWQGDSWKHGGAPIWLTGSYDPDTNLTFWGTGNPGPDWDGDLRPGDNLYSCSVIAVDADTGKLKWHYQFSPHNEFDWDAVQIPVLVDLQWENRPRKVMLWANRNGMFYVLDRTTGQFLRGSPFANLNWATGFNETGRPLRAAKSFPTVEGTLIYPGNQGATNWYSPSYSPTTGLFYIPTWENSSTTYRKGVEPLEFHEGQSFLGTSRPLAGNEKEDTSSVIRALDPRTGQKKWDFRMAADRTEGGILTTASDVLFSGGRDGTFYALDSRNGALLWRTNLGISVSAGPITFEAGGKQYVSVQAGSALFTFGLPD
jgi:alcohol dehydrogenase (cytochrome c)